MTQGVLSYPNLFMCSLSTFCPGWLSCSEPELKSTSAKCYWRCGRGTNTSLSTAHLSSAHSTGLLHYDVDGRISPCSKGWLEFLKDCIISKQFFTSLNHEESFLGIVALPVFTEIIFVKESGCSLGIPQRTWNSARSNCKPCSFPACTSGISLPSHPPGATEVYLFFFTRTGLGPGRHSSVLYFSSLEGTYMWHEDPSRRWEKVRSPLSSAASPLAVLRTLDTWMPGPVFVPLIQGLPVTSFSVVRARSIQSNAAQ